MFIGVELVGDFLERVTSGLHVLDGWPHFGIQRFGSGSMSSGSGLTGDGSGVPTLFGVPVQWTGRCVPEAFNLPVFPAR